MTISPDCAQGKCPCTGSALDEATDQVVDCDHPCHATWTVVFDNTDAVSTPLSEAAVESLYGQRATIFPTTAWRDPVGVAEVVAVLPAPRDVASREVALTMRWISGDRDAMAAIPRAHDGRVGIGYEVLRTAVADGAAMVTEVALLCLYPAVGQPVRVARP
jgi:hypothetical protein